MGANQDGSYQTYCIFSAVLALNRCLHAFSATTVEQAIFSAIGMRVSSVSETRLGSRDKNIPLSGAKSAHGIVTGVRVKK